MCMCVFVRVCVYAYSACGGEKRASDSLKLEVIGDYKLPEIMLETELGTSGKSV